MFLSMGEGMESWQEAGLEDVPGVGKGGQWLGFDTSGNKCLKL